MLFYCQGQQYESRLYKPKGRDDKTGSKLANLITNLKAKFLKQELALKLRLLLSRCFRA
jgi:hypothetical protein